MITRQKCWLLPTLSDKSEDIKTLDAVAIRRPVNSDWQVGFVFAS